MSAEIIQLQQLHALCEQRKVVLRFVFATARDPRAALPFAVIRSVSDSATGDAGMEYPEMVRRAAARSADLIRRYLTRL